MLFILSQLTITVKLRHIHGRSLTKHSRAPTYTHVLQLVRETCTIPGYDRVIWGKMRHGAKCSTSCFILNFQSLRCRNKSAKSMAWKVISLFQIFSHCFCSNGMLLWKMWFSKFWANDAMLMRHNHHFSIILHNFLLHTAWQHDSIHSFVLFNFLPSVINMGKIAAMTWLDPILPRKIIFHNRVFAFPALSNTGWILFWSNFIS